MQKYLYLLLLTLCLTVSTSHAETSRKSFSCRLIDVSGAKRQFLFNPNGMNAQALTSLPEQILIEATSGRGSPLYAIRKASEDSHTGTWPSLLTLSSLSAEIKFIEGQYSHVAKLSGFIDPSSPVKAFFAGRSERLQVDLNTGAGSVKIFEKGFSLWSGDGDLVLEMTLDQCQEIPAL